MKWNAKKQPSILTFFEINFFFYPYVLHIKQKNTVQLQYSQVQFPICYTSDQIVEKLKIFLY